MSNSWVWGFCLLLVLLVLCWRLLKILDRANSVDWGVGWLNRVDGFLRIFCHRYHRLSYEPLALPESGPALVASNHISGLDPLLLVAASKRPLRFLIAMEQYNRFGLKWIFHAAGCIPVDRSGRPELAFREALRALAAGEVVAVFPHGGIHLESDPPRPLKAGVIRLAQMAECTIHPVRLDGIAGKGHVLPAVVIRGHAKMKNLPPIYCEHMTVKQCLQQLSGYLDYHPVE